MEYKNSFRLLRRWPVGDLIRLLFTVYGVVKFQKGRFAFAVLFTLENIDLK